MASAGDAWAIRGPGLLVKRGLIEGSGSSREGVSGRERNEGHRGDSEGARDEIRWLSRRPGVHRCDAETSE